MVERSLGGRWAKGCSGNPAGRPAKTGDLLAVEEAARAHTVEAIATLVECMRCEDPSVRLKAANSLLDRAHGRPPQNISGHIEHVDITAQHLEALRVIMGRQATISNVSEGHLIEGDVVGSAD